jgi:S1-C subfamily serine protease
VPGGFEAFARYRISRAAVAAATAEFRASSSFRGLTVAPVFPLVARDGAPASHAMVVAVRPRSAADGAGARVGDAVVEVGGRRIITALDFALLVANQWKRTPPGRRMVLVLDRAGTRESIGFVRPEPPPRAPR